MGAIIGATFSVGEGRKASYLGGDKANFPFWYYLLQQTGTWVLIFTNFVPISLMVTLELVKFW